MHDCVFCNILRGEDKQSNHLVYQDKLVSAFMDRIQPNPGHILIVPNEHIVNIFSIDEDLSAHLFKIATKLAKVVKDVFKPHGLDIYQCNGKCAGQSVFHFHLHIFPRTPEDGFFRIYPETVPALESHGKLKKYAESIRKHLK